MKQPNTSIDFDQLGNTARATRVGNIDEIKVPTYGINRNRQANAPQNPKLGSPRAHIAIARAAPYPMFTNEKGNKYREIVPVAVSIASPVSGTRLPASKRTKRS